MSAVDRIVDALSRVPDVGSQTAQFVGMVGSLARINIGPNTIDVPCVGFYPPVVSMIVQVERRNGKLIVTGPASQMSPIGEIKAGGSPKATVTVDGVDYLLGYRDGYTPVVGDQVEINPASGIIQGKVTATQAPEPPSTQTNQSGSFKDLLVQATSSGNYWSGGGKWNLDTPWASTSNTGAWFYGSLPQGSLKGTSNLSGEIYLPATQLQGTVQLGLHGYSSKPGGAPTVTSLTAIGTARGWVRLPAGFANALRDSGGGIAVKSSNGFNKFRGRGSDTLSGALRFSGTR